MTYTPVHNRLWSDGWIRSLNALDRYLFLYLLTNGRAKLTGIYELPLDLMAAESGIDERDLKGAMLQRLEPKVYYREGWVILVNYPKHHIAGGHKFQQGVKSQFEELPAKIQDIAKGYGYPMDRVSVGYRPFPDRIEENRKEYISENEFSPIIEVRESNETERLPKSDRRVKDKETVFLIFGGKQPWWYHKQQREAALRLYDRGLNKLKRGVEIMSDNQSDQYCPQALTPFEYESKLPKLNAYIKKNGL